jgi:hypothetical protein
MDDSRLVRGLRSAEAKLKRFSAALGTIGTGMMKISAAVLTPFGLTVRAAADAQESLSRFEQVFKDQADAAAKFADDLAESVGRSEYEIRDALATFQSFFVGLGFGGAESRKLSQRLQSLALDFASFNNITDDEAIQRFISALSGSGEVLDRFGINIKQAALKQELLRMGLRKSWTAVTEQEKAMARLNIIARAMGDQGAIGDAERTSESFTNQMRRLRGQLRDTAVDLGTALIPVLTELAGDLQDVIGSVRDWAKDNGELIVTIAKVATYVGVAGLAITGISKTVDIAKGAIAAYRRVTSLLGTTFTNVAAGPMVAIAAGFAYIAHEANSALEKMKDVRRLSQSFSATRQDEIAAMERFETGDAAERLAAAKDLLAIRKRLIDATQEEIDAGTIGRSQGKDLIQMYEKKTLALREQIPALEAAVKAANEDAAATKKQAFATEEQLRLNEEAQRRIEDAQIDAIEDATARRLAALRVRHRRERREAKKAGLDLESLIRAQTAEYDAARQDMISDAFDPIVDDPQQRTGGGIFGGLIDAVRDMDVPEMFRDIFSGPAASVGDTRSSDNLLSAAAGSFGSTAGLLGGTGTNLLRDSLKVQNKIATNIVEINRKTTEGGATFN